MAEALDKLPFQKPAKRIRDPRALRRYRAQHHRCEICGKTRSLEVHHIRSRKMGGGDVEENLLVIDAGGRGCHDEWHAWGALGFLRGHPEMPEDVRQKIRHALGMTKD